MINRLSEVLNSEKTFRAMLTTTGLLLSVCSVVYVYGTYIQEPFLSFKNLPFQVLSTARPGETVFLNIERCNATKKTKKYSTTYAFRNEESKGSFILKDETNIAIPPGCHRDRSGATSVPTGMPKGVYTLYGVATVDTPFGKKYVEWYSEPFSVLEPIPLQAKKEK